MLRSYKFFKCPIPFGNFSIKLHARLRFSTLQICLKNIYGNSVNLLNARLRFSNQFSDGSSKVNTNSVNWQYEALIATNYTILLRWSCLRSLYDTSKNLNSGKSVAPSILSNLLKDIFMFLIFLNLLMLIEFVSLLWLKSIFLRLTGRSGMVFKLLLLIVKFFNF